jgi:hypothetical protein
MSMTPFLQMNTKQNINTHNQKCSMDLSPETLTSCTLQRYFNQRFVAAFFTETKFSRGITISVNFITCFQAMCCTMQHHFEATKQLDL